ncbi:protein of unknown function [Marivirga sericea]|uniref:DUF4249 domain-containing protein n=1 Tax=Marivirga sericea TaxID=1028 RepID=A0A1X7KBZ0_9BACT|nr:DUF4249 domain-containing protein [Marivirga sericea]SMG38575.1 protein of unknown function [Marivirga sericea]
MTRYYLISIIILASFSCIDPFAIDLEDDKAGGQLVVEGILTAEDKPQIVRLSRSAPVEQFSGYESVSGATVSIKDDLDNCFQLDESQPGVYVTNQDEFSPVFDRSYQLDIALENGVKYISDFQKLEAVAPIDRLWVRGETESFLAGSNVAETELLNVYTNVNVGDDDAFLSYDYEGVYEFKTLYQGETRCWDSIQAVPIELFPLDSARTCFKSQEVVLPLNLYTTRNLKIDNNTNQKILSISPGREFFFGYSMLVWKYKLTEAYFNYLDQIKEQSSFGGDLFAPPPTPVVGNIHEEGNDGNRALGYFTVLSSTSKRIFITNQVLSEPIRDPFNRLNCVDKFPPTDPPRLPPITCCDCLLLEGATDQKPDFWPL